MTIRPGESWGRVVPRPDNLRVVEGDAALAAALGDGSGLPTAVIGGDLARTLGESSGGRRGNMTEYPIDLLRVTVDDGREYSACAHLIAHLPAFRTWIGSLWAIYGNIIFVHEQIDERLALIEAKLAGIH